MPDDLSRNVYCILGLPIDSIEMPAALALIGQALANRVSFLFSTPNLNFLVSSQSDPEFRESLLASDLCTADGMPIVWIARILGLPIKHRVAGSDLFRELNRTRISASPITVFFFGGEDGVAAAAGRRLNDGHGGLRCVGSLFPGFGSVSDMSRQEIFETINSSKADFLVVSLGAKKGQCWLQRNRDRLSIPIQSHLGAVVNFQAGVVTRAPAIMGKSGLEWLWRIKEEPNLWRRYWRDGLMLLRLLVTRVVPLALLTRWLRWKYDHDHAELVVKRFSSESSRVVLRPIGPATARNIDKMIQAVRWAMDVEKDIVIDFSNTSAVDLRFLGLLLMLDKVLKAAGNRMALIELSRTLKAIFYLNGLDFLLEKDGHSCL